MDIEGGFRLSGSLSLGYLFVVIGCAFQDCGSDELYTDTVEFVLMVLSLIGFPSTWRTFAKVVLLHLFFIFATHGLDSPTHGAQGFLGCNSWV